MRRSLTVSLCLSIALTLALTGCKAKELVDKASISHDLDKRGTTDLMKQVADDKYTPPADGRLTDAQIRMYLKVREQEKKIAQVAKDEMKQHAAEADKKGKQSLGSLIEGIHAMGSAADFLTADIRAAKDLGYNTQEYLWVKQQVLGASTAVMAKKFADTMSANFDKAYVDAKKAYDEAKDETTKKLYADVLAGYDKSRQELKSQQTEDPAVTYNRQLLSKYENALNAFTAELEKYEDKPGEMKKAMQEFEKSADQARKQ
jgi:hypothetical protein